MNIFQNFKAYRNKNRQDRALSEFEDEMFHLGTFLILIVIASGIASLGLLRGNLPVVIGAMIITPLVSPFVGIGLSAVTHRPSLFDKSMTRAFLGTLIFWLSSYTMGHFFADFLTENTLIKPVDIDLPEILIAIFSGTIAALALASEKIYHSLSGAAISLSIAPPLAISAIGFSLGQTETFQSAITLFAVNVTGLMVMSLVIFLIFGFGKKETEQKLQ